MNVSISKSKYTHVNEKETYGKVNMEEVENLKNFSYNFCLVGIIAHTDTQTHTYTVYHLIMFGSVI